VLALGWLVLDWLNIVPALPSAGGLDRQFEAIFRRAFASRVYPPSIVQKLGIKHVKV
jgi:hypothetical protein